MSGSVSGYIRQNVLGLVAIYIALGGTALATHPDGANTISTGDIIDGQVQTLDIGNGQIRSADVRDDTLVAGGLRSEDVAADTLTDADIADSAQFNGASAGGDLAGTYPNPAIAAGAVSGGAGGEIVDDSITGADVDESTLNGISPTGAAGGDLTGTYPNPTIATGAVGSAAVSDNSLTGTDIDESTLSGVPASGAAGGDLTGTYPNPTIAAGAVGSAAVADDSLGVADLGAGSVGSSEVVDNSLGVLDIGPGAVGSSEVVDNSLGILDIGTGAVGTDEVALNSLGIFDIGTGAIGSDEVVDNSLGAADLGIDSVALSELDHAAVFHSSDLGQEADARIGIINSAVSSAEVLDGTLTGADINESTLTTVPDASTLDGIDSTQLVVGRSSQADSGQSECVGNLPEDYETCADVTVNFPHSGRALILATAGWEVTHFDGADVPGQINPPAYSSCQIQIDESTTLVEQFVGDLVARAHRAELNQESVAMQAMTPVLSAGSHLIEFNCKDYVTGADPPSETDIDDQYLSAIVFGSG